MKTGKKIILAGLVGAVAGIVSGIMYAPQIKTEYKKYKKLVEEKIKALKKAGKSIDKKKYAKIVEDAIKEVKSDAKITRESLKKISDQLKEDWISVKSSLID